MEYFYAKQTDCNYNCGNVYLLTLVLAVLLLWLIPALLPGRLPAFTSSPIIPAAVEFAPGEGSAEEYALFLQWLECYRRIGRGGDLLQIPSLPLPDNLPSTPYLLSLTPTPSPSLSPTPSPSLSPTPTPTPSPSPRIKPESPPPRPPSSPPTSPHKPNLKFAPGTLVLRRRPSSDFVNALDRLHPTDGPFMLLRTHPFSPTTWQLDVPTGSKMPLWHPEIVLARWDEGIKEVRSVRAREDGVGKEYRVHVRGWGCEDDVWVKEEEGSGDL